MRSLQALLAVAFTFVLGSAALALGQPPRFAPSRAPGVAIKRIVSVAPSITEMLYALGLENRVIGVSSYCNYPPEVRNKAKVGDANALNEEVILGLKPDLILLAEGDRSRLERLASLGSVKVVLLPTHHVADIYANLASIGRLTGEVPRATGLIRDLKTRVAGHAAPRGGVRPRVFYMVWDRPLMTAGPDSYLSDLITLAGGTNVVASGAGSYPTYSWEALLAADPDVILGPANMGPALKGLSHDYPRLRAVKANRVRTLPDDLVSRPGPRVVEALDAVVAALRK